jgi:hypothetical protein
MDFITLCINAVAEESKRHYRDHLKSIGVFGTAAQEEMQKIIWLRNLMLTGRG